MLAWDNFSIVLKDIVEVMWLPGSPVCCTPLSPVPGPLSAFATLHGISALSLSFHLLNTFHFPWAEISAK